MVYLRVHSLFNRIEASICERTFTCTPRSIFDHLILLRDGTINYQGRQHAIDFELRPYYSDSNLSFSEAQQTLSLQYKQTLLYWDNLDESTTGLDALAVRGTESSFPELPIPSEIFNHLSVDCEGLVLNADGS